MAVCVLTPGEDDKFEDQEDADTEKVNAETPESKTPNGENDSKQSEPVRDDRGGLGFASNEPKIKIYPCIHMTWRKIATVKLRDRMELLKECRRCQHKRVFVVRTTAGQTRAFVDQSWYDPPHVRYRP